jgi:HEAT repeat protein
MWRGRLRLIRFERSVLWPITLISLLGLVGCQGGQRGTEAAKPTTNKEKARALIRRLLAIQVFDASTWMVIDAARIEKAMQESAMDRHELLDGLQGLLDDPLQESRTDAVLVLARMKDAEARVILLDVIDHGDAETATTACYQLAHDAASDPRVRERFDRLVRSTDENLELRLAALFALEQFSSRANVELLRAGLASQEEFVRRRCELQLEKMGLLRLPLPDHVYEEISTTRYERILKEDGRHIVRQVEKDGFLYFERVIPSMMGPMHHWYKTRLPMEKRD